MGWSLQSFQHWYSRHLYPLPKRVRRCHSLSKHATRTFSNMAHCLLNGSYLLKQWLHLTCVLYPLAWIWGTQVWEETTSIRHWGPSLPQRRSCLLSPVMGALSIHLRWNLIHAINTFTCLNKENRCLLPRAWGHSVRWVMWLGKLEQVCCWQADPKHTPRKI